MPNNCPFCDRSMIEERIVAEDKNFYLVATLGQITDGGYTLLIPKEHVLCFGAMDSDLVEEAVRWVKDISEATHREYGVRPAMFEHGEVGQTVPHAHLHFVPAGLYLSGDVREEFSGRLIQNLPDIHSLRLLYERSPRPYLLWRDASQFLNVCWRPNAPKQYFRTLTATKLGRELRANWRNVDPKLDKKNWSSTVCRLRKHFKA